MNLVTLLAFTDNLVTYPGGPPTHGDLVGAWLEPASGAWLTPHDCLSLTHHAALGVETNGAEACIAGQPFNISGGNPQGNPPFDVYVFCAVPDAGNGGIWVSHQALTTPCIYVAAGGSTFTNNAGTQIIGPGLPANQLGVIRFTESHVHAYTQVGGVLTLTNTTTNSANIQDASTTLNRLLCSGNAEYSPAGAYLFGLVADSWPGGVNAKIRDTRAAEVLAIFQGAL